MNVIGESMIEYRDSEMVSFQISDEKTLYHTGMKVLKNLGEKGLLPAYQTWLNGKIHLLYDTGNYETLAVMLPQLRSNAFLEIVKNLLDVYQNIKKNGFIQIENVCLDEEHIFVNPATMQVFLIYLPLTLSGDETTQLNSMDVVMRKLILSLIENNPNVADERVGIMRSFLKDTSNPLESYLNYMTNAVGNRNTNGSPEIIQTSADKKVIPPSEITLTRIGGTKSFSYKVNHRGLTLGRSAEKSDGVIPDSSVSGQHCRITYENQKWILQDMNSTNGTTLNGFRVPALKKTEIHNGDKIGISRFVFSVKENN